MLNKRSLLVIYTDGISDPPSRQAAAALAASGFDHLTLHAPVKDSGLEVNQQGISVAGFKRLQLPRVLRSIQQPLNWLRFCLSVRSTIWKFKPDVVVAIMHHALAALPKSSRSRRFQLVACIYDIPPLGHAGRLDRRSIRHGWSRLAKADLVWASDKYKADLARKIGHLVEMPVICHNCPSLDYLPEPSAETRAWLRTELRRQGMAIGEVGGSILLRAGAIGEYCGIEETLAGMNHLPDDYVFVMMGRPPGTYKAHLIKQISALGLAKRAILLDRPDEVVWKNALQGADIGHLIHGPFPPGYMTRLYELNSSLSNNRLFQYMAAGLPIISYDDPRMSDIYEEVPCFRVARLSSLGHDIIACWRELGNDNFLRKQMGDIGRKAHLGKYCWEQQFGAVMKQLFEL